MQERNEKEVVKVSDVLREIDAQIKLLEKSDKKPFLRSNAAKVHALSQLKLMIRENYTNKRLSEILIEWGQHYNQVIDQRRNKLNKSERAEPTSMRQFVDNFISELRSKYIPANTNEVRITTDLQRKLEVLLKIKNDPKLNGVLPEIKDRQARLIAAEIQKLSDDEIYRITVKLMQDHIDKHPNLALMRSDTEIGDSSRLIKDMYNELVKRLNFNGFDNDPAKVIDPRLNTLHWFVNYSVSRNLNKSKNEDPTTAVANVIINAENERRTNNLDYSDPVNAMAQSRQNIIVFQAATNDLNLRNKLVNESVLKAECPVVIKEEMIQKKAKVGQKLSSTLQGLFKRAEKTNDNQSLEDAAKKHTIIKITDHNEVEQQFRLNKGEGTTLHLMQKNEDQQWVKCADLVSDGNGRYNMNYAVPGMEMFSAQITKPANIQNLKIVFADLFEHVQNKGNEDANNYKQGW